MTSKSQLTSITGDDDKLENKWPFSLQERKKAMTIFYDKDRDYAEVFFKRVKNYGETVSPLMTVFKSERSDKIVGYGFEEAHRSLFKSDVLTSSAKLAAFMKIIRAKEDLTQKAAANKIGELTFRHYQRIEAGEDNPTLSTIDRLMKAFPKYDFSSILKHRSSKDRVV